MMPQEILLYLNLALSSLALLGHAKGYFSSGEKKLAEDFKGLTRKLAELVTTLNKDKDTSDRTLTDHDRRIQAIESEIKHLPDRDATHRMELALSEMKGQFIALEEKLKPIAATSERLHELLMEQARK